MVFFAMNPQQQSQVGAGCGGCLGSAVIMFLILMVLGALVS